MPVEMIGWIAPRISSEIIDLKEYFDTSLELEKSLSSFSDFWFSGGNVFVLRKAMKRSGLDTLITGNALPEHFVYGGYSAGCCVLSHTLEAYQEASKTNERPHEEQADTIWEGLGVLECAFMPHFKSDHAESTSIHKEIRYSFENNIPYKTFRDADVLII